MLIHRRSVSVASLVALGVAWGCAPDRPSFPGPANSAGTSAGGAGIGGALNAKIGGAGGRGGAAGAGMLMVVKVPCTASSECDDKNFCNGGEICFEGFCAPDRMNMKDGSACMAPPGTAPVSVAGAGNAGGAGGASQGPTVMSPANNFFCTKGSCARGYCGDGYTDSAAGEQCDDANTKDDDGCRKDCQFTCETSPQCDDGNSCSGTEICLPATHMCATGVVPVNGAICDTNMTKECRQGSCVNIGCGNGSVDPTKGEACDDGNATAGDGCEIDCKWTCVSDAGCSDNNACNGTETCDLATHICKSGVAIVVSNDGNACTEDLCNPTDGKPVYPLKDADSDGEASKNLGACGTDCNDADPVISSRNQEICGDGKDNDCNPTTGDLDAATRYYLDCDGDGYATAPLSYVVSCGNPPPPQAGLCKPGAANLWTTTVPDPQGARNWDCNDGDLRVSPLQTQYFPDAYVSPITGSMSWDYDCDGLASQYTTSGSVPTNSACGTYSCLAGYESAVPPCGQQGTYSKCQASIIIYSPITPAQGTIILPPIYCDSNATYRYLDNYHTQTCR